jgi:hypothetical protein
VDVPAVHEALDLLAISRLQSAYGDAITRRAWTELGPMFLPDCPIRLDLRGGAVIEHVGPGAIGSFIASSLERFEFFEFALLNAVVSLDGDGDGATGRLYMWELRQDAETQRWTNAFGLYEDTYVRVGEGGWVFASRHYSSLARTAADGRGMDVFSIPGGG